METINFNKENIGITEKKRALSKSLNSVIQISTALAMDSTTKSPLPKFPNHLRYLQTAKIDHPPSTC